MADENLLLGVAIGRRVLQILPELKELSLLEVIALATNDVLTVVEGSDDAFAALDEWEALEASVR